MALPGAPPDAATIAKRVADAGYDAVPEELAESLRAIEGALGVDFIVQPSDTQEGP